MSNLQNLTDIILKNCIEIKYFTFFNAYNINDLSSSNNKKSDYKNKLNDLKTNFFLNFNKMESHLLKMKSSISLVNPNCFRIYLIKQNCVHTNLGFIDACTKLCKNHNISGQVAERTKCLSRRAHF